MESNNHHNSTSLLDEEVLSQQQIQDAIDEIVLWFQQEWTIPGKLPPFELDAEGQPLGTMDLITDVADYLPQLYMVGAKDYVREQVNIVLQSFQQKPVIITPRARRGFLPWIKRSNPFYSTDFLLGLVILRRLERDLVPSKQLVSITRCILNTFLRNGWMSKEVVFPLGFTKRLQWKLPISESNSLLFVEILVELYHQTREKEFLVAARKLVKCWLRYPFTRTWGLVPQLAILSPFWNDIGRFSKREVSSVLYKHNTALLHGLLMLHRKSSPGDYWKEAAIRVVDSMKELLIQDDGAVSYRLLVDNIGHRSEVISLGNSVLIEGLLDIHELFHRKQDLETAIEIAQYFLKLQRIETGLVANSVEDNSADIDRQTDFAVNLHRLYSVTGDSRFLVAASRIALGQIMYHRTQHGYMNSVNAISGETINRKIETRYTSLFLKSLLCLQNGKEIWNDANLRWVLKDR